MKIIVYQYQGRMQFFTPGEGARLALQVTLQDGSVLISAKGNIYQLPADEVMTDELLRLREPLEAWKFARPWPKPDVEALWAESVEEQIERLAPSVIPDGATQVKVVDAESLPEDRTFRDAWTLDQTGACVVDMAAAREIHRNTLRAIRSPKLQELDIQFMRALERGDSAAVLEVGGKKAVLRNVTADPAIDAAKTPEELKAVIPAALAE